MDIFPNPKDVLTDVIALSKKQCHFPIQGKLTYAGKENFLGRRVDGYHSDADDVILSTKQTALALCKIQNDLNKQHLSLYIYDAYRPLRAVKDFSQWFKQPVASEYELERKKIHYPNIEKTDLDPLGYAAGAVSRHNFGHVIDLTLISLENSQPLSMGACFDYFDELSHNTATAEMIGQEAYNNRLLLAEFMSKHGFIPYEKEFWHFEYHIQEVPEPMDLTITQDLQGINVE